MKPRIFFTITMSLMFSFVLDTKMLMQFSDVYSPRQIEIRNHFIYIADQNAIKVYDLNQKKFLRKFGKKGSGPGEFINSPRFQLLDESNEILVYSDYKLVLFKMSGQKLFEKRYSHTILSLLKTSNRFFINSGKISGTGIKLKIDVYDNEFNLKNTIHPKASPKQKKRKPKPGELIWDIPSKKILFYHHNNSVYISNKRDDLYMEVYSGIGDKKDHIKLDYQRIVIDEREKEKIKNDLLSQKKYERLKKRFKFVINFPEKYPAIQDFKVVNDSIYIKTYRVKNDMNKFLILDLKGNLLKKSYLPVADSSIFSTYSKLFTFYKSKYYYLKPNDEEETFDLYVSKI